jgi:UDP-glucose 4-epimerase
MVMTKILVTGRTGFIGSHVVELFIVHGLEVVILNDLSIGRTSNVNPQSTFYQKEQAT